MHRTLPAALFLAVTAVLTINDRDASARTSATTVIGATAVDAAFTKGAPLLETAAYKIHASRRDEPGMAEIHTLDTDILYVLDGRATLVTGGELRDGAETASGEVRGASIQGGEEHTLVKGDVVVVPQGTPHWFREVQAPFLYYVVKVTASPPATGAAR